MECPYCNGSGKVDPSFGARLRAARNDSGKTQEQIAPLLGVSRAQLANLEANRSGATMDILKAACDVFNKDPNWFLGFDKG